MSELLKVNRIDFRKSENIVPMQLSKGVIYNFLAIYLENGAVERMSRFVDLGGLFGHFPTFLG